MPKPTEFSELEKLLRDTVSTSDTIGTTYISSGIRGPRSRIAIAILVLLYARPMRSNEIAQILKKSSKYISSYLTYWKARGYVAYASGYWFLTKQGEDFVRLILSLTTRPSSSPISTSVVQLAYQLISEHVQQTKNNNIRLKQTDEEPVIQSFTVNRTSNEMGLQDPSAKTSMHFKAMSCLDRILGNKNLLEDEMLVLRHLIHHYIEWNSTYKYLDQLAEELHYDVRELMTVLRRLQSKKLIYIYTDRKFGVRIGLGKTLKQLLDLCLKDQSTNM